MSKRFTKIICAIAASIFVFGVVAVAGCSPYYGATALGGDYKKGEVLGNGGFAVEKGNYIYYINGAGTNTADNEYGKPVKGAVYRISKDNLKNRKYSSVDKVVGNVVYSANYDGGIFIYGDRIYYGTPSTAKNSEGVVLNSNLDMKSTKLDGTETMKDYYVQFPSASYQYRYVEEKGTVYLLYVATGETLYDETSGVTNLHSYNTKTEEDTLLAYNVSSVTFDSEDKTNPRVYYTMNVKDYRDGSTFNYNQIYTVTASATKDKFKDFDFSKIEGWNDDEDEGTVDRYINCGDLVLDGIGKMALQGNSGNKTPFNYAPETDEVNNLSYTYEVKQYVEGHVFYTRTSSNINGANSEYLFSLKDTDEIKPIENNIEGDTAAILTDGSTAGGYKFLFKDDELDSVLYLEDSAITVNYAYKENGYLKLNEKRSISTDSKYYAVVRKNANAILGVDGDYLYYSVTGGNSNTINRINYKGSISDYYMYSADGESQYDGVKILDLDASSSWYKPEIIDGYLMFASTTSNMTSYNYIMVFDMHKANEDGTQSATLMDNADIRELNKQYEGIEEIIEEVYGDTDKYPTDTYKNVQKVLRYAMFDGDYDYLTELAKILKDNLEDDEDEVYSDATLKEVKNFLTPADGNAWGEYTATKKVNGKDVYANRRNYYYSVLGVMSDEDKEAYAETLKTTYLESEPVEEEVGWYEGISTVEKVFFIIGMCLIGIVVIGGGVWLTLYLIRRNKKLPEERKRRIKVDTTDDKNIDVYDYEGKENNE